MKALLDTNIVVDILSKRDGYENSLKIFQLCEVGRVEGYVSVVTVTDVMYILRKHIAPDSVRAAMSTLLAIVEIADVTRSDIKGAFSCGMKDFEDAVQAMCTWRIGADFIVTRNVEDFELSPVRALPPVEMIERLK